VVTRVAVLGGGMAALATAFELTRTPERRERFDVTIHQTGWRLGGKCASGRNQAVRDRIEEHGLHLWFGSYDNACELMRACYEELDRPPSAPLATFDDAFKPSDEVVLYDQYAGCWSQMVTTFRRHPGQPGDGAPIGGFWALVQRVLEHVGDVWLGVRPSTTPERHPAPDWLAGIGDELRHQLAGDVEDVLRVATGLARHRCEHGTVPVSHDLELLCKLLDAFRHWLWDHEVAHRLDDDRLRQSFTRIDGCCSMVIGLIRDDVLEKGFDPLDREELSAWLLRHGLQPVSLQSPFVRSWYSGAFAFVGGHPETPDAAAGTGVHAILRQHFTYKGAIVLKMQAGMGDAVIAPFYEVLTARGVGVEFFSRVAALGLSPDHRHVDTIELVRQATTTDGSPYRPLIDVKGLPCWPSEPLLDQLVPGSPQSGWDFGTGPPEGTPRTLRRGVDFDVAVLAMSVAALPAVCRELLADDGNQRFRQGVESASTVATQALQVWTRPDPPGLGWTHGGDVTSTYVEPLDTYCDMSHLVPREAWTAADGVGGIAYFCGVQLDGSSGEDRAGATQRAHDDGRAFLDRDVTGYWPTAGPGGAAVGFDWDNLVDIENRSGLARFEGQYWRANVAPTERYVLSRTGSMEARLRCDESGYENLVLAGDWTKNGLDLGCVEAAVMSGREAARAVLGEPVDVPGEDRRWIDR
jgi:uncharacterized protein with NAD-binding domain and iron-sulfur cluster